MRNTPLHSPKYFIAAGLRCLLLSISLAGLAGCSTNTSRPPVDHVQAAQAVKNPDDEQDRLLAEYRKTDILEVRNRDARALAEMWSKGLLRDETIESILRQTFRIEIQQLGTNGDSFSTETKAKSDFPYPPFKCEFKMKLYLNNEAVDWPDERETLCIPNELYPMGGLTGTAQWAQEKRTMQYRVHLSIKSTPKPFEMLLWSNKITLK